MLGILPYHIGVKDIYLDALNETVAIGTKLSRIFLLRLQIHQLIIARDYGVTNGSEGFVHRYHYVQLGYCPE